MFKNFTRKTLVVAASGALLLGAVACSNTQNAGQNTAQTSADKASKAASSAAASATAKAADAAASASAHASHAAAAAPGQSTDAHLAKGFIKGESVEAKTIAGTAVTLPKGTQTAWENAGGATGAWGGIKSSETLENGNTLTVFEKGVVVAFSDAHGAVPVIGKIAETWIQGGGLKNELGLPTAPEHGDAVAGWTQSFDKGLIEWSNKGGAGYQATITKK